METIQIKKHWMLYVAVGAGFLLNVLVSVLIYVFMDQNFYWGYFLFLLVQGGLCVWYFFFAKQYVCMFGFHQNQILWLRRVGLFRYEPIQDEVKNIIEVKARQKWYFSRVFEYGDVEVITKDHIFFADMIAQNQSVAREIFEKKDK